MANSSKADSIWDELPERMRGFITSGMDTIKNKYSEADRGIIRGLVIYHLAEDSPDRGDILMELYKSHYEAYTRLYDPSVLLARNIAIKNALKFQTEKEEKKERTKSAPLTEDSGVLDDRFASGFSSATGRGKPTAPVIAPNKISIFEKNRDTAQQYYEGVISDPVQEHIHATVKAIWDAYPPESPENVRKGFSCIAILAERDSTKALQKISETFRTNSESVRDVVVTMNKTAFLFADQQGFLKERGIHFMDGEFFLPNRAFDKGTNAYGLWQKVMPELMPVADIIVGLYSAKRAMDGQHPFSIGMCRVMFQAMRPESPVQVKDFENELASQLKIDKKISRNSVRTALKALYGVVGLQYIEPACLMPMALPPAPEKAMPAPEEPVLEPEDLVEEVQEHVSVLPALKVPSALAAPVYEESEKPTLASRRELEEMVRDGNLDRQQAHIYFLLRCAEKSKTAKELSIQFGKTTAAIEAIGDRVQEKLNVRRYGQDSDGDFHETPALRPQ